MACNSRYYSRWFHFISLNTLFSCLACTVSQPCRLNMLAALAVESQRKLAFESSPMNFVLTLVLGRRRGVRVSRARIWILLRLELHMRIRLKSAILHISEEGSVMSRDIAYVRA